MATLEGLTRSEEEEEVIVGVVMVGKCRIALWRKVKREDRDIKAILVVVE